MVDYDELVRQSQKVAVDGESLPMNIKEFRKRVIKYCMINFDKELKISDIENAVGERDNKYYCDLLFALKNKGYLVSPRRGVYKWNVER